LRATWSRFCAFSRCCHSGDRSPGRRRGISSARAAPRDGQLDALFEARRADTGEDWSQHVRKNSGFDFVFAPHKSVSLAAEFAPTEAERQMIRNATHAASDDALRYAAQDLGFARKGHAGEKGAEAGEIGWVTFAHDAARPTVAVQNGPDGATYLMDAPIAGDPHYHLHNFIPNLVVTDDGRVGSIDSKALTAHKVPEYGAFFQARLADRLRSLGLRIGLDAGGEAAVALDIPESAVATFSKRDRQVVGDAQRYAREHAIDWDELSLERKKQMLHEASAAGRLGKTKEEAHAVWREQVAELGWTPTSVLGATPPVERTSDQRREAAYGSASASLSAEFQLKAVLDAERLRVHAARGLIEAGAAGGRDDVDAVVSLIETRGFAHDGKAATLIFGLHEGKERISHTEQLRIEQSVAEMSRAAARDRSVNLSDAAIRAAIGRVEADDAGVRFSKEQLAAIHALVVPPSGVGVGVVPVKWSAVPLLPTVHASVGALAQTPWRSLVVPLGIGIHSGPPSAAPAASAAIHCRTVPPWPTAQTFCAPLPPTA